MTSYCCLLKKISEYKKKNIIIFKIDYGYYVASKDKWSLHQNFCYKNKIQRHKASIKESPV